LGGSARRVAEPHAQGAPRTAMLSFTATHRPARGPSATGPAANAAWSTWTKALISGSRGNGPAPLASTISSSGGEPTEQRRGHALQLLGEHALVGQLLPASRGGERAHPLVAPARLGDE